ncbi:beta-sarcoglycan [Exaiptasia diaphana]|uniref:Beta-sarcoglycan n=1 Tax=Exaiptasia diaphana TaxID=2652724 RepID=A0A913YM13_EXADI|nr:beta-sarcoglycan [Exaiptasia diaphana]KXJ26526.1 Beta-sarcoglycan [Exaiptasia diaphana]
MAANNRQNNQNLVDDDSLNYVNNFDAGQSKVKESSLHKTGIRGTKVWILIAVLVIALLICIINLVILAVIYGVIRIDKDGVESISFFDNGMIRFTKPSDLETVTVYRKSIGGFNNRDLAIETTQNKITLHGGHTIRSSQVEVSNGNTSIIAKNGFKFVDPFAKKEIVSFDGSNIQFLQESVTGQDVHIDTIRSHRIVSNEFQNLTLNSDKSIIVQGSEGIHMDGKTILFDSALDINVTSSQAIKMDAKAFTLKSSKQATMRLCICRHSGLLFTSETTSSCSVGSNPC